MSINHNYYIIDLPNHNDARGKMCVAESGSVIPFVVQRIFYDYDNIIGSEHRGNHANRESEFVFICLNGSCTVKLNDGEKEAVIVLDNPRKALYINKMVWKEMYDYTKDSILLVLSNCKYDPNEYIKNYNEYIREVEGK